MTRTEILSEITEVLIEMTDLYRGRGVRHDRQGEFDALKDRLRFLEGLRDNG